MEVLSSGEEAHLSPPRLPSGALQIRDDLVNSFGSYANDVDKMTQEVLNWELQYGHPSWGRCGFIAINTEAVPGPRSISEEDVVQIEPAGVVASQEHCRPYSASTEGYSEDWIQRLGQSAPSMAAFAKARDCSCKNFRIIDHKPSVDRTARRIFKFEQFSLTVLGKTIAPVGSSGSWKKPLVVSFIERFYDPPQAQVLLRWALYKTLKLRWLDSAKSATAARVANAYSFIIKLPDGFDTQVILFWMRPTGALDSDVRKASARGSGQILIGRKTLVIALGLSPSGKLTLWWFCSKAFSSARNSVEFFNNNQKLFLRAITIFSPLSDFSTSDFSLC
nr:ABC transporter B family member 1 [Ipomoea batatas]